MLYELFLLNNDPEGARAIFEINKKFAADLQKKAEEPAATKETEEKGE